MELIKLVFIEQAGTDAPLIRPIDHSLKSHHIDLFAEATEGGTRLTSSRLAKVASPLIGPSSRRKHKSFIDNGWDQKRIMFGMVVATLDRSGGKTYEYIVGYTDHAELSKISNRTVRFDRNMKMYFNQITRVHMTLSNFREDGRNKQVWQPRIQQHDQILRRSGLTGQAGARAGKGDDRPVTLRPTDIFRRGGSESSFGAHIRQNNSDVVNLSGAFSTALRASNLSNNSPTNFMQRSLNAYVAASGAPSSAYLGDDDREETIASALDKVQENQIEQDPFIESIKRDSNILASGYITFGELMDMNPDFNEDEQLGFKPYKSSREDFNQLNSWNEDTNECIAATIIANTLPGIMINSMYSEVKSLRITNLARQGEYKVLTGPIAPFVEGLSVKANFAYFEDQCEHVLLEEVSKGGMFDIEATIDANIDTEIRIRIQLDGGREQSFRFPAFASGCCAMTMDNSLRSVDQLAKGIIDLSAGLANVRSGQNKSHVDEPRIILGGEARRQEGRGDDRRRDDRDTRRDDRDDRDRGGRGRPSDKPKSW